MGSVGNQNPLAPYQTYRDCSQAICSRYCPQWCYIIFPPPPNLEFSDNSGTTFSPLIIAIIGILASGFLLMGYYIIIRKYCTSHQNPGRVLEANPDQITLDQSYVASAGLDETFIKSITVFKYKKSDGLIEGTECAVCLNEFQENDSLRLLTNCTHAFHLPCIDTWLKTHSNCPLCRSTAAPAAPAVPGVPPPPPTSSQTSSTRDVSSLEIHRQNDLVLVVEDCERSRRDEVVISFVTTDDGSSKENNNQGDNYVENPEMRNNVAEIDQEGVKNFRRSISLGTFSSRRNLLIADILKIDDDDDDEIQEVSKSGSQMGIASYEQRRANCSSREMESTRSPVLMERSNSTKRFVITHEKGKNSLFPN